MISDWRVIFEYLCGIANFSTTLNCVQRVVRLWNSLLLACADYNWSSRNTVYLLRGGGKNKMWSTAYAHDCVMRLSNVGGIAIIDWKRKLNLLFLYEFFHRDFYFFVYRFPLEAEAAVSDKWVWDSIFILNLNWALGQLKKRILINLIICRR